MRRTAYLLLVIRLSIEIYKVHSLPYEPGPGGSCNNTNTEYVPEGSNLCCKKCLPGTRFRNQCSATTETECEQCPPAQYTETYHFVRNCHRCPKCDKDKGLQYFQKCSKTTRTRCTCLPGMYCTTAFKNQFCEACTSYASCVPGHGVSRNGSADSDVECEPCPDGTFSDMLSYTQPCQKHIDCKAQGSVMLHPGNATSDSVCDRYNPQTTIYPKTPTEPETTTLQATTVTPNTNSTQKETSCKPKTTVAPSDDGLSHKGIGHYLSLGKPAVRFNEIITVAPLRTAAPSLMIETSQSHVGDGQAVYTGLLRDRGNSRTRGHVRSQVSRRSDARPVVYNQEQVWREMGRVTEQPPGWEQGTASDRRRMQPLLGYDWIAGLLDAESSLTERSEEFFSDLRTFRQVNRDQCVHSLHVGLLEDEVPPQHLSAEEEATEQTDTHQCTFCYRINGRLFPASLDPQESCPVCKMPKADHPHSAAEPAFIRVSIPRSTLLPAYQYKAHRRCSFDPSDSLGLPSHCLSGWSNPAPSSLPLASSLDLRSYLRNTAPPTGLASALPQPGNQQEDLSVSRVSGSTRSDQLLNVSRLARYHIQRLPPANKPACCSSYPVL